MKVKTTAQIYAGISYQPLNLGEAVGTLKIMKAVDLGKVYVSARDIVVLDAVPNDIEPTAAIVTNDFRLRCLTSMCSPALVALRTWA